MLLESDKTMFECMDNNNLLEDYNIHESLSLIVLLLQSDKTMFECMDYNNLLEDSNMYESLC